MSKATLIDCHVDNELLATLDRLAASYRRDRAWIVDKLLTDAAGAELEKLEAIEEGIADADAGRVIPHEEVIERLKHRFPDKADSQAA